MNMLRLIVLFFRPALDFASMGAGIMSGISDQYAAHTLPSYRTQVGGAGGQADAAWFTAMQAIQSATDRNTGMVDPVILDSYSKMLGIDLSGIVSAGGQAGQQYGGLSDTAGQFGGMMQGQGTDAFGRGADLWNTASDPQNQLHDYMRGQTVDNARAADSARGIAMSPYSAGNEADATRQFEMDWQNQQLQRQLAGSQGANQAGVLGGADINASMGYYGQQPGFTMQGAMAPVQAQEFAYGQPMNYATAFSGAEASNIYGPQMGLQNQISPYLGLAQTSIQDQSVYDMNLAMSRAGLTSKATNEFNMGSGQGSGAGNPMSWMGMGGMGGG